MSGESNLVSLAGPASDVPAPLTKKLRIVLLSPRGPLYRHRGGIWKKTMRYAPLTLTTLASLVPAEIPAEVSIVDEGIDEIVPERIEADLVGISAITGTAPRSYEIAANLRKRGIPVVLGGVHPTLLPEEAVARVFEEVFAAHHLAPAFAMLACDTVAPPRYVLYVDSPADERLLDRAAQAIDSRLRENFHYNYARDLGQLACVRAHRVNRGAEVYLTAALRNGQKAGDVKAPALDRRSGWSNVFAPVSRP